MYTLAELRYDAAIEPQSSTDTAFVATPLDTRLNRLREVVCIIQFGAIGAADVTTTALQESDTTSAYTTITGLTATVTATDDNKVCAFFVNMANPRKRYLIPAVDPGNAATLVSSLFVSLPDAGSPVSAATAGSYCAAGTRTQGLFAWKFDTTGPQ